MHMYFPFLNAVGLKHIIIPAANLILILKKEIFLHILFPLLSSIILYLPKGSIALLKKEPIELVILLLI